MSAAKSKATTKLTAAADRIDAAAEVPVVAPTWTPTPGKALALRTCNADMTAHGGFHWPGIGQTAEAPDWDPEPRCGGGLHGLLWGAGSANLLSTASDAAWLVVEVDTADVVDIDRKVKFPRALVVYVGSRDECVALIQAHAPAGTRVVWGTATAGDRGTATAGYRGTATAGDEGTATAGYRGTATAGDEGLIVITYYDTTVDRYRRVVGQVGVGGIEAGVAYHLDAAHVLTPVADTEATS